jgi:glucose-1-phosphate cytidylyltransferase
MKAVILAGGLGTRISEETHLKPKPMIVARGVPAEAVFSPEFRL